MDKFLRLVRYYVNASFVYLSTQAWNASLVSEYLGLVGDIPLSPTDRKVPDGLKYHILDVWVEELNNVDRDRSANCPVDDIMGPVSRLEKEGVTKLVRERARETLCDERLVDWRSGKTRNGSVEGEEWEGLGD